MTSRRQFLRHAPLVAAAVATGGGVSACTRRPKPGPGPPAAIVRGPAGESIDEFLTSTVPESASMTAVAARDGEIVYGRGFGMADRPAGIAAGLDTVYDIGSVTKQFTASAVLTLEMAGALATADPVAGFVSMPTDKQDITLHHLLTHTSGLVEQVGDDYAPTSRADLLTAAGAARVLWAPGTAYRYSNLGYSVLAAVIEVVSGTGYESYLAEHLFTPAGMTETGYVLPQWDPDQVAVEYDQDGTSHGRPPDHPWDADGPYWNLRGNGGILSTAQDMVRWHLALQRTDILSSDANAKLFTPHVLEDNGETHYGYGWVVVRDDDGRTVAWHNGGNGRSYAEYLRSVGDDLAVFWATNSPDGGLAELDLSGEIYRRLRSRR